MEQSDAPIVSAEQQSEEVRKSMAAAADEAQSGGVRAAVLGINDGLVTNVALILGVAGGTADPAIIRLAGVASLVAGAFSMALGEYVSMRAQADLLRRVLGQVSALLKSNAPEACRVLYDAVRKQGLSEKAAHVLADDIASDPDPPEAVEMYSRSVLGINPGELGSPIKAAVASLVMFALGAFVPLLPWYFVTPSNAALVSILISAVAAFIVGSTLGYYTDRRWLRGGVRILFFVAIAAAITYSVGRIFRVAMH